MVHNYRMCDFTNWDIRVQAVAKLVAKFCDHDDTNTTFSKVGCPQMPHVSGWAQLSLSPLYLPSDLGSY